MDQVEVSDPNTNNRVSKRASSKSVSHTTIGNKVQDD